MTSIAKHQNEGIAINSSVMAEDFPVHKMNEILFKQTIDIEIGPAALLSLCQEGAGEGVLRLLANVFHMLEIRSSLTYPAKALTFTFPLITPMPPPEGSDRMKRLQEFSTSIRNRRFGELIFILVARGSGDSNVYHVVEVGKEATSDVKITSSSVIDGGDKNDITEALRVVLNWKKIEFTTPTKSNGQFIGTTRRFGHTGVKLDYNSSCGWVEVIRTLLSRLDQTKWTIGASVIDSLTEDNVRRYAVYAATSLLSFFKLECDEEGHKLDAKYRYVQWCCKYFQSCSLDSDEIHGTLECISSGPCMLCTDCGSVESYQAFESGIIQPKLSIRIGDKCSMFDEECTSCCVVVMNDGVLAPEMWSAFSALCGSSTRHKIELFRKKEQIDRIHTMIRGRTPPGVVSVASTSANSKVSALSNAVGSLANDGVGAGDLQDNRSGEAGAVVRPRQGGGTMAGGAGSSVQASLRPTVSFNEAADGLVDGSSVQSSLAYYDDTYSVESDDSSFASSVVNDRHAHAMLNTFATKNEDNCPPAFAHIPPVVPDDGTKAKEKERERELTYIAADTAHDITNVVVHRETVRGYSATEVEKVTVTVTLEKGRGHPSSVKAYRVADSVRYYDPLGACVIFRFGSHYVVTPEVLFPSLVSVLYTLFRPPSEVRTKCACSNECDQLYIWDQELQWVTMHQFRYQCKADLPHFSERLSICAEVGWWIGSVQYQYLVHTLAMFPRPAKPLSWWNEDGFVPQFVDPPLLNNKSDALFDADHVRKYSYCINHMRNLGTYMHGQAKNLKMVPGEKNSLFPFLLTPDGNDEYFEKIRKKRIPQYTYVAADPNGIGKRDVWTPNLDWTVRKRHKG